MQPELTIDPAVVARFWARVDKHRESNELDPCWTWTGAKTPPGYGVLRIKQVNVYTHRFAYEQEVGPIPGGFHIDHLCRNTSCVNPTHLEAVTPRVNALRGTSPAADHARATHCSRGHPYTADNIYHAKGSGRRCRTCHIAWRKRDKLSRLTPKQRELLDRVLEEPGLVIPLTRGMNMVLQGLEGRGHITTEETYGGFQIWPNHRNV
jgi:hypothetical protein